MSHADNLATIRTYLTEKYTRKETTGVPKRKDLTFGNSITKMPNAVCFYVDMRSSRKVMQDSTVFVSAKAHKAFLQALVYCIENRDGHFRSFNGDGALAFFVGSHAASKAVRAAMDFKAYVLKINEVLKTKGTSLDFGVGIAGGDVHVVKSGKAGDDSTKQDLVWISGALYVAVELSDFAHAPNNIWITDYIRKAIGREKHLNVVNSAAGKSMWKVRTPKLKSYGAYEARCTGFFSTLFE